MTSASAPCVICGKSADPAYRPFCSKRCADVDLQRWLTGSYVVPGDAAEEGEEPSRPSDDEG